MIDTHCHLTFPDFRGKIKETLAEAAAAGVTGAITISTTTLDCLEALAIAKGHPDVWCTAGVHPLYADQGPHLWANLRLVAANWMSANILQYALVMLACCTFLGVATALLLSRLGRRS